MKILLIGATGFVGAHLLHEALIRSHHVTAMVRDLGKLPNSHENLKVVQGDVNDPEGLVSVLAGHDLVLNAFNAGWDNPNLYRDYLAGYRAVERATEMAGVPRLLAIGGAGSLYVGEQQLVDGPAFPEDFKPGAKAARDYLNELRSNQVLDWTFFSPAIEMHRGIATGRTGQYRLGTENPVVDEAGRSVLSGEDLAVAVLDEVEQHRFSRQRFTAAY